MKCIQYYPRKSGEKRIERVAWDEAQKAVDLKLAFYVPRAAWKREVRDAAKSS